MNETLITNFVKAYAPGKELAKPDETLLEFAKYIKEFNEIYFK